MTEDQIRGTLVSPEVVASNTRTEPRVGNTLALIKNKFTIKINHNLNILEMDGILSLIHI